MTQKPLWQWTAKEISTATRENAVNVTDVVDAVIERMDRINPRLNAVVENLSSQAREHARTLDNTTNPKGPLHGVPITIKINVDQIDHATSNGVPAFKDLIADQDAPIVRNLVQAGAVVIGRTNTPEFSFRAETENPLYGRTHNPWGDHVSPGGSSGGAGSAVMAGIGALAHGNDIGGSLRFPASANGAFTVKPGLGRIPAWNPSQKSTERGLLAQSMSVQGLISRTASDLSLAMPCAIKGDVRDPFHVPFPWDGEKLETPIKVAYCPDDFGFGLHPEIKNALHSASMALDDAGFIIEDVDIPLARECGDVGFRALMGEVKALMGDDIETFGSDVIRAIFDEYHQQFPPYEGTELLRMMAQRTYFARQWSLFLDEYPLVLTPFLLTPFFHPNRDTEGTEGTQEVLGHAHWSFIFNFTGLPAGNLPAHVAELPNGPQPIGVQIAGRRWREDLIVQAMHAIEIRKPSVCDVLWARMNKALKER